MINFKTLNNSSIQKVIASNICNHVKQKKYFIFRLDIEDGKQYINYFVARKSTVMAKADLYEAFHPDEIQKAFDFYNEL